VGSKAYIFGGETAAGKLAGNEMHVVNLEAKEDEPHGSDYAILPAVADEGSQDVPAARRKHAACALNVCVAVSGGVDENDAVLDEGSSIWLFNTAKSSWEKLDPPISTEGPGARSSANLFNHGNDLVLYGGQDADGAALKHVWFFSYATKAWTQLPEAPVATTSAALSNGVLHLISGSDNMSSDMYILPLTVKEGEEQKWHQIPFPTNPLTPGPRPRAGAGLVPISTGYGRNYLLYLLGARKENAATSSSTSETEPPAVKPESTAQAPQYWSDMWTYQLPSSEIKPTGITDAVKPAKIKDSIRHALGYDSGGHSWAEVEVLPPADLQVPAGKVHPGPRGFFGCDVMKDGRSVVLWGGVNAKGEREGDGWVVRLE
jgi:hypothetical protein